MSRRGRRALGGDVWLARFVAITDAYERGLSTEATRRELRIRRPVIAAVRELLSRAEARGYAKAVQDAAAQEGGPTICGGARSESVEETP